MKSKKTFTVMSILIAVLVLGVGYATVSEVPLNLTGSVNVKANAEFVVEYDTTHEVAVSTDATIDTNAVVAGEYLDASNATMTVNLDSTHRSAYAIYKIDNLSEELKATISAEVTSDFIEDYKDYLAVAQELCTTEACATPLAGTQLGENESAYLKVTVSLTKLPVEDIANAQFTITTKATPVEVELGE